MDVDLYQMLSKFPGWMAFIVVGTLGGSIAWLFSHRQYLKMVKSGYEDQIKLKDDTIKMLQDARQAATSTLEQAKLDAVRERDQYRAALHEEKAHHQATLLRLTEMESRPDLSKILSMERDFHEQKMKINQEMLNLLGRMDTKLDTEHKANTKICQQTAAAMGSMIKYFVAKGLLPNDHPLKI